MSSATGDVSSIAIVGFSCRFPGDASNPSKFWDLLKNARSGFSQSTDRFNAEAFSHPKSGKRQNVIPTTGGYFLKQDPYVFDAAFFNITAAEAMALDPRQRIAMEVAYEALESAGLPLSKVAGTQTACFMGSSMSDYRDTVAGDFQHFPKYHILGVSDEMISNRISHFLDIHGPSATIQTACSSSLVATHIACQSLRCGESEAAITGGVGLTVSTHGTMHLNNLGFLNPEGHSRSFDENAAGYGRGEGCGVLILKRLDKAIRDGDNIRAIIRGSGVNSDGWTQGVTMPSMKAQAALIKHVYESNGLDFGSTQYVEAHGTGTKVGDPIEAEAIYSTVGQSSSRKRLYLGSVKANIGHLEAAAGVASIIKGILALEHGLIPPNINFSKANPAIPLDKWNMVVPTKVTPWPATQVKRMSVSGFGMGGTNAHIVLEAYHGTKALGSSSNRSIVSARPHKRLFLTSSHDKAGLKRVSEALVEHLDGLGSVSSSGAYLANLAHTLAVARSGLTWRSSCIAETAADLREQLVTMAAEDAARAPSSPPRIGFVFTGQGAQWARMGIEMMQRPVFKQSVADSARFLKEMGCDWDPITELGREQEQSRLGVPEISQPICSVLQIALVDELRSWGVTPSRVVGHSSGELAAAYTIGALSHRDALAAAYLRGVASAGLKSKELQGGMMAVGMSRDEAQKLIEETKLEVTVACVNSPSNVTLSGDAPKLESLRAILSDRSVFARRLKVDVAYHSPHMQLCAADYYASMTDAQMGAEEAVEGQPITMVSSVTVSDVDADSLGPYYWVRNLTSPVLFTDAVRELVSPAEANGARVLDLLLEVGPHSALGGPIEQILSAVGITNVDYQSMLTRGQSAVDTSLSLAADLSRRGVPLNVAAVNGDSDCHLLTDLPPYPWNHSEAFRADSRVSRELLSQQAPTKGLMGAMLPRLDESEKVWRGFIDLNEEPWLRGHTIGSTVLFPGAGMVSLVLEAAQQIADKNKTPMAVKLRDISFLAPMSLSESVATEVTIHLRPQQVATSGSTPASWWEFEMSSCLGPTGQMRDVCRGLVSTIYAENRSPHMAHEDAVIEATSIAEYRRELDERPEPCSKQMFYDRFAESSLPYGEAFQAVENCHPGPGKSSYGVKVLDVGETFTTGKLERAFLIHAATLDAILQGWLGSTCESSSSDFGFGRPMLPSFIGEFEISLDVPADVGYTMPAFCRSHRYGLSQYSADINVFDRGLSKVLLSVIDFRTSPLDMDAADEPDGGQAVSDVDPADTTAVVHWDYSLNLLAPVEITRVISGSDATVDERLTKVLQMAIHQDPAIKTVELVPNSEKLAQTVVSRLPQGVVLPSQVNYAVADLGTDDQNTADTPSDIFGQPFAVGDPDAPLPPDLASTGIVVVSRQTSSDLKGRMDDILERFLRTVKPGTLVAIAGPATAGEVVPHMDKNLELICSMPADTDFLNLYKSTGSNTKQADAALENGVHEKKVLILEPTTLSTQAQSLSFSLQAVLTDQGYSVDSVATEIGDIDATAVAGRTCISLLELEKPILEDLAEADFRSIQQLMVSTERLLWVTCGDDPSFGVVDGLARCVNNEVATGRFQVLHLSSEGMQHCAFVAARILEASDASSDNEFRECGGLLQVQRIYQSPKENSHVRNHLEDSTRVMSLSDDSASFHLAIEKHGLLDSLHFVRDESTMAAPLADDELELQVKATGVNFRDIMASMGLLPVTAFGQEASGIVLRAGSQAARSFKPGDRVSSLSAGGTHATKTRCDSRVTVKIPETMPFEEGAAAPMAVATAYYTLVRLAKLRPGQSVLIHAAAGGVGQTAIQLAQHLGLVVYASVGSKEKRTLLMEEYGIAEEHIFFSRDTSFAKGIQRMTKGRGVDCILNSLSGELLRVSWTCLATFGTFIELGVRDITDNMRLDMRPFRNSATFTFFDIPTLIEGDPASLGEALSEGFKLLQEGILHVPHPLTVYPVGKVEDAFRSMQQGRHVGKIVLSVDDGEQAKAPVLCKASESLKLDPNATYMLIGGLGGLGRSLAREFVASGARHIAFLSRSGDSKPEAKETVDELVALGAQVKVFSGDVADQASFLAAMEQCSQQLPPIKGVVQMAMVLRDVVFENMSHGDWTVGLRPKVQGTWNLHQYFGHERPLDFMILCSSISGISGNPGQAQYDAGNTYQDTLAHYRRDKGLKAVSVNLGIMLDVGIIAESVEHNFRVWEQVLGIREPTFHAVMKSAINGQLQRRSDDDECPAQLAIGLGNAGVITRHRLPSPPWFQDSRFGPLAVADASASTGADNEGGAGAGASLASRLTEAGANKDQGAATSIITGALAQKTADILRIPVEEVDAGRPMYTYGVDSLVALEVRNWITRDLKANMPLLDILAAVPLETFAGDIAQKSKFVTGAA